VEARTRELFIQLLLPSWMIKRKSEIKPFMLIVKIFLIFFLVNALFVVSFRYTEGTSWGESIWHAWQTSTTVGYGNRPAVTTNGRIATMIFGYLGIIMTGLIIGESVNYAIDLGKKRRLGQLSNPYRDGYVIFNYPGTSKFKALVEEIRHVESNVGICIVDDNLAKLPEQVEPMSNIHFVKGNVLKRETYEKARLKDNKSIIVFPMKPGVSESDGGTQTVVQQVSQFVGEETRIIHELVDSENEWLFKNLPSISIPESIKFMAIVQECQDPHSAETIKALLSNTTGANPKTVSPGKIAGLNWKEFYIRVLDVSSAQNIRLNPLAIIRNGVSDTNPAWDTIIYDDDYLQVAAFNDFDWPYFMEELLKVGKPQSSVV